MPKPPDDREGGVQQKLRNQDQRRQEPHGPDAGSGRLTPQRTGAGSRTPQAGVLTDSKEKKGEAPSAYGERCIRLFVFLLLAKRRLTLDQLAGFMEIPKSNVLRMVDAIEAAGYRVKHVYYGDSEEEDFEDYEETEDEEDERPAQQPPEGRRRVRYWLETCRSDLMIRPPQPANEEIEALRMCAVFAKRLLGVDLRARAEVALALMESLTQRERHSGEEHYGMFTPGTIDYSQKGPILTKLSQAMEKRRVCKITYQSPWRDHETQFHVMPLKIFCHKDALYLQTKKALEPAEKKLAKGSFNPLLAIHRIKHVEMTDQGFPSDIIEKFDFEKAFNQAFGVIKEKEFKVVAELTDWAATYVEEREWGPKQKLIKSCDGKVTIEFKASSEPEVLAWILQFGENGKLLEPDNLATELSRIIAAMKAYYP